MKRNITKISLDLVMTVILVLLYNSHAINMAFHEISGLILFGLFTIHVLLNRKWVTSITAKIFHKPLAPRVRFGYIINVLLLVSFLLIIISGICTSQVVFPTDSKDSPWRLVHHFFAGLSLILVGIHVGLHWSFVSGMFKKMIQLPRKVTKPLNISLLLVVLAFGLYSVATSNFIGWFTAPFIGEESHEDTRTVPENTSVSNEHAPKSGEIKNGNPDAATKVENSTKEETPDLSETDHPVGEKKSAEADPVVIVDSIATYVSILGVFAAVTYYLDKYFLRRKKNGRKSI